VYFPTGLNAQVKGGWGKGNRLLAENNECKSESIEMDFPPKPKKVLVMSESMVSCVTTDPASIPISQSLVG